MGILGACCIQRGPHARADFQIPVARSFIGIDTGLFEPIHGSYPQAKGKDIANPMATILATAMLLDHLGLAEEAKAVRNAIQWALAENIVTEDLDPDTSLGCNAIGDIVSEYIERGHLTINRRVVNLSRGGFL